MSHLLAMLHVRPEEQGLVLLVGAVFLGTQATHGLSANTADTLFFSRFGVEFLPQMYILLGLLTMGALLIYSAGLARLPRRRFYPALLLTAAAMMFGLRAAVVLDARWVYAVIWLTATLILLITFTFMWNLAGDVADARTAKRLYPLFASSGILGGFIGNVATGPLASAFGAENLLLVVGALLVAVAWAVRRVAERHIGPIELGAVTAGPVSELRAGFVTVVGSPLLRLLAAVMLLGSLLFYAVAFPFSVAVADAFDTESEIASYLGFLTAGATAVTLLVSLLVTNQVFARLGVVLALFVVATAYVGAFALWLAAFTLLTASIVRFVQWVMVNGVGATAQAAIFNVVRGEKRGQVIAFAFAVPVNLGVLTAGVLLWVADRWLGRTELFVIGLVAAITGAAAAWLMRSRYGDALVGALREGMADAFTGVQTGMQKLAADADAVAAAVAGLSDSRSGVRRVSAEILGKIESTEAVDALYARLEDPEVEVRLAAIEALHTIGAAHKADTIEVRLGDDDPAVRALAVDAMSALVPESGFSGALEDHSPLVRARAAVALGRQGQSEAPSTIISRLLQDPDPDARLAGLGAVGDLESELDAVLVSRLVGADPEPRVRAAAARVGSRIPVPDEVLIAALGDGDERVRIGAAETLRLRADGTEGIFNVLRHGQPAAQEAALRALEGRPVDTDELVEWALPKLAEASRLRSQRSTVGALSGPEMLAAQFLGDLLADKEWRNERLVVRALTLIHTAKDVELIVSGLRSTDAEARAQALEALEAIGDKRVARTLLPLLESEQPAAAPDMHAELAELSADPDPWVRALAVRSVGDVVRHNWQAVVRSTASDPVRLVRDAATQTLGIIGGDMADTLDTLGAMDRILFLRQVPIFGSLDPEDLQRIAELATEQSYAEGEAIFRDGDEGDEMYVIVRGRVRASKVIDGRRQTIREAGSGEHVGELAPLRDAPRAVDVTALTDDARVLVIGGGAFKNMLVDRPRVARAMLTSLAERLAAIIEEGASATHKS